MHDRYQTLAASLRAYEPANKICFALTPGTGSTLSIASATASRIPGYTREVVASPAGDAEPNFRPLDAGSRRRGDHHLNEPVIEVRLYPFNWLNSLIIPACKSRRSWHADRAG
jgi:hypothetical protein